MVDDQFRLAPLIFVGIIIQCGHVFPLCRFITVKDIKPYWKIPFYFTKAVSATGFYNVVRPVTYMYYLGIAITIICGAKYMIVVLSTNSVRAYLNGYNFSSVGLLNVKFTECLGRGCFQTQILFLVSSEK